jgi:integrase
MNTKLTARAVAAAKLPAGKADHILWDSTLPGFGFRMRKSGGRVLRSWIVQYRRAGSSRRLLLGSAEVLNADQARAAAKEALAKVALGGDPQGDKVAARNKVQEHSFRAVVDDHVAAKEKTLRPATFREVKRYLTGPYFQPLHKMKIDQVTRRDVAARLTKITNEHGPIVAAAARNKLSAFFAWCMGQGLAEANPVIGTNKPEGGKPRERVLDDGEIAAIWRAADKASAFGKIVKLLLLTGCRRTEVGGARWDEINMQAGEWRIPGERAKNGRVHTLPLPPMAMEIIRSVPALVGRDLLFGEHNETRGFTQWGHDKNLLDARLGNRVAPWTLHDLRRTVATKMADIGIQPHIIEAVLNHVSGHKGGVAGIYNRSSYEREVKAALGMWADHIRALVEGGERKVLAFPHTT